ncbi:hypothetical protein D3C86_1216820 [compost metagenome]
MASGPLATTIPLEKWPVPSASPKRRSTSPVTGSSSFPFKLAKGYAGAMRFLSGIPASAAARSFSRSASERRARRCSSARAFSIASRTEVISPSSELTSPSRLVALLASSSDRLRSASSSAAVWEFLRSFSAIRRSRRFSSSRLAVIIPVRSPFSRAIACLTSVNSLRAATSLSVSPRMPGTTAPRRMALRTEASASSGETRRAGGGFLPMRCNAARTSASTPRLSRNDALTPSSRTESLARRSSPSLILASSALRRAADAISSSRMRALS